MVSGGHRQDTITVTFSSRVSWPDVVGHRRATQAAIAMMVIRAVSVQRVHPTPQTSCATTATAIFFQSSLSRAACRQSEVAAAGAALITFEKIALRKR